jgi:hypothetical protein
MAKKLVTDVFGLPNYFSTLLAIRATGKADSKTLKKVEFEQIWNEL